MTDAKITKYAASAAIGYSAPEYAVTLHGLGNLTTFAVSYNHRAPTSRPARWPYMTRVHRLLALSPSSSGPEFVPQFHQCVTSHAAAAPTLAKRELDASAATNIFCCRTSTYHRGLLAMGTPNHG